MDRPLDARPDVPTLILAGCLDGPDRTEAHDLIGDALEVCDGSLRIVLLHPNLTVSAAPVLLHAAREAAVLGVELCVTACGPQALSVLRAAGLTRLLEYAHDSGGRAARHLVPPV